MQVHLKRAGEDREKENKEFHTTVDDQRETQKLLQTGLAILQESTGTRHHFCAEAGACRPASATRRGVQENAAAGGVMVMIQRTINDVKSVEAHKGLEEFVKETNASIEAKHGCS